MSDRVVSILRTAVPTAWGALLGLLLPHLPWLPATVSEWLASTAVVEFVVGLCIVAWYAVWRWAEPKIPAWLVTLVLGSSKAPTYNADAKRWASIVRDSTGRTSGGIVNDSSVTFTIPGDFVISNPYGSNSIFPAAPPAATATERAADEAAVGNDRAGFPYTDGDDAA